MCQTVCFLSRFGLKTDIDFDHYGLQSGMVFKGTTRAYTHMENGMFRSEIRSGFKEPCSTRVTPRVQSCPFFMKNSFTYSGAVLWNSLPCHVREAESLSQFKRLVNVHF